MTNYFPVCRKYFLLLLLILFSTQPNTNKLFAQTTNAGKWYIDKNATGTNNGTSWVNAWTSFSAINWNNVSKGDTIFISGGVDSTVYYETLTVGASGTAGNPIVITKGKDAGHNGKVVIDGQDIRQNNIIIPNRDYVKVIDLKIKRSLRYTRGIVEPDGIGKSGIGFLVYDSDNIEVDSCIIEYDNAVGIQFVRSDNAKFNYNYVYTNRIDTMCQVIAVNFKEGCDNSETSYNTIIMRNERDGTLPAAGGLNHKDLWFVDGMITPYCTNGKVHHNFMIHDIIGNPTYKVGIYAGSLQGNWEVYDNVIVVEGASYYDGIISMRAETPDVDFNLKIYNNTLVSEGTSDEAVRVDYPDSLWFINNLVYKPNSSWVGMRINGAPTYINSDYNRYNLTSGWQYTVNGVNRSLATWQAFNYNGIYNDTHSSSGTFSFVSLWSTTLSDWKTTGAWTGIDLGTTIPLVTDDILGVSRPQGAAYDIGAFEFKESSSNLDTTPPQLMGAAVINPTTIELTFSEALDNSSALLKSNYSINNGIVVNSVSLSTDSKKVTLFTTTNSANQTYTVTVSNIRDLAGNIISVNNNSAQYSYVGDTTPPNLLSAAVINPTTIELTFSEALENSSASTKANYSINNGITVNNAVLSTDQKKVTLTTSQHIISQNYIVTVSNVKDLAGNNIAPNSSVQYSFVNNTVGNLKANVKIFLQGPYQNNIMTSELSGNELLPNAQPYNKLPWLYNGTEVLGSGASSSTDWVLVELRSAQNPVQVISRRACLLRNDGRIIEPNGNLGVTFNNLLYGSYYIAVFHRNHLAVMTAVPVLFSPDNSLYDFTNALTKAYGQSAMTEMTTGIFGMYAGDGNGDGIVDDKDRNEVWSNQNGNLGYYNGDFNLDSGVTVKDINDYWNLNSGKRTQVP